MWPLISVQVFDAQGWLVGTVIDVDVVWGELIVSSLTNSQLKIRVPIISLLAIDDERCVLPGNSDSLHWSIDNRVHLPMTDEGGPDPLSRSR
jgi:hypothetical protein